MASRSPWPDIPSLVVVVGETASGKSALAIELAQRFNGEIICADSRTVYRSMDIGTAKPSPEERAAVPHHGLDVIEPGMPFTAYDFQQLAFKAIDDISARGKLPIMVGGTGLYVDSVMYNFQFRKAPSASARLEYQSLSVAELQQRIRDVGLELPENASNPRHLTRLLESGPAPNQPKLLRPNTIVLGLKLPPGELAVRIQKRVGTMFAGGLVDEVRNLRTRYGTTDAFRAPGYKAVAAYLDGVIDLPEAKRRFRRDDLRLAKRQRTWFRRNANIHWLMNDEKLAEAVDLVTTLTLT